MADVLGAGFHDNIAEERYHRDPCAAPSLSSSIARILVDQSPAHAFRAHPRLGNADGEESSEMDIGSAAHAIILEGRDLIEELPYDDLRTNAAKAARDAARAAGKIPLITRKAQAVRRMVKAVRAQLDAHADARDSFVPGKGVAEQTMIWREENGIWCRARIDWRPNSGRIIDDLKTTGTSANPDSFGRQFFSMGYDFRAAFYARGMKKLTGERWVMRFTVAEVDEPHALSVVQLHDEAVELADREVERAIRRWGECLSANEWPGYPNETVVIGAPAWRENQVLGVEMREHLAREGGKDLFKALTRWQAPL